MVRGIQDGDPEAIEIFILRCHRAVFALSCRICADPELRRDCTHDILLRLVEELSSGRFVYRRPGCLWAWFRKRSYFLLLNRLDRQRMLHRREVGGDLLEGLTEVAAISNANPEEDLERAETRRTLEKALEHLPSVDQRRALQLLLDQGLSYEEIAHAMGAPINTVRSWIRRGRIALRKDLSERFGVVA